MHDIIVFSQFYKPHLGGVERYVESFYTNKLLSPKRILIVTSKHLKDLKSAEKLGTVEVLRLESIELIRGKYFIPTFKGLKQIIGIFEENKIFNNYPEIHTHTRFYLNNFIATKLAKKYHLKHFHFEHGASFVQDGSFFVRIFALLFDMTLSRYILKNADLVFPISKSVKKFLQRNYKNITFGPILYNSYNFKNKNFVSKKKPKKPRLLFVGRITKSKGIYELAEACKLLSNGNFPFTLTIVGEGSEKGNLKKYIKNNSLGKCIFIKGGLSYEETQREYTKHDIFVNPSYTEGFGLTTLEALANNLLIVATDAGGTSEIIDRAKLIPLNLLTPKNLSEKIKRTYYNWDEEILLHKALFDKKRRIFNIEETINKYLNI